MNLDFLSRCIYQAHTEITAGNYDLGITWCKRALEVHPNLSEAWYNLGLAQKGLRHTDLAIQSFLNASICAPDSAEAQNGNGLALLELGCEEQAEKCLLKAITLNQSDPAPLANLGLLRKNQKRLHEAASLLITAINLAPHIAALYSNLAGILNRLSRFSDAISASQKAIQLDAQLADAWNNLSIALARLDRHKEAIEAASNAFELNPSINWLLGSIVYSKLKICDWSHLKSYVTQLSSDVTQNKREIEPLAFLSIVDDPCLQQKCASIYTESLYTNSKNWTQPSRNKKTRIGYISSDFKTHAVSFLTAGLIEAHDRSRFEIQGFDIGEPDDSAYKQRLSDSFELFHALHGKSTQEIIECIQSQQIDILIDLNGHTKDAVTDIFGKRAAPIQINFLGFPGTMGASFMDYIIGDSQVIPLELAKHFTEKVIYLPNCFQPNDHKREIGKKKKRSDYALDDDTFVFGCFNQPAKITPEIFTAWVNILSKVPHSVLWLAIQDTNAQKNLCEVALKSGLSGDRIVFGEHVDYAEHLMRHSLVDLMLDTFPFNGGTTTSDALWGGAPVLTLAGQSFASRMGASLLHNVGLGALITSSVEAYENKAVELASTPKLLETIRSTLKQNLRTAPLFNTERYTRNLEEGLTLAMERHLSGLEPSHIFVQS